MKVIIAGSRDGVEHDDIAPAMEDARVFLGIEPTQVLCGMARGADMMGKAWADLRRIPVKQFPARWHDAYGVYNPRAGFLRNADMAREADALVALWDGASSGTRDMITRARKMQLLVWVYRLPDPQRSAPAAVSPRRLGFR